MRPLRLGWILAAVVALAAFGCSANQRESPILRLSADEALAKGKEFMERKKWFPAREHLLHAFEVEPNSASGREALLLVADAHFFEGGSQNFIKSEAKYRDFQNRFPTSERAGYVQYQIASSLAKRMRRPDRDQSVTREAIQAYDDLVRIYPTSEYVPLAHEQIAAARDRLAEAELIVARYNYRRGLYAKCGRVCFQAAIARLDGLLEDYPTYGNLERVYYLMAVSTMSAGQAEKSEEFATKLRDEYPQGKFLSRYEKAHRRYEKKLKKAQG